MTRTCILYFQTTSTSGGPFRPSMPCLVEVSVQWVCQRSADYPHSEIWMQTIWMWRSADCLHLHLWMRTICGSLHSDNLWIFKVQTLSECRSPNDVQRLHLSRHSPMTLCIATAVAMWAKWDRWLYLLCPYRVISTISVIIRSLSGHYLCHHNYYLISVALSGLSWKVFPNDASSSLPTSILVGICCRTRCILLQSYSFTSPWVADTIYSVKKWSPWYLTFESLWMQCLCTHPWGMLC